MVFVAPPVAGLCDLRRFGGISCSDSVQALGEQVAAVTERPRTLLAAARPEVQRDIYGFYDRLRDADPCYWDRVLSAWVVTSHELVSAAANDARLSSVRFPDPEDVTSDLRDFATVISRTMLYRDALEHTRLRKAPAAPSRPGPSRRCGR